MKAKSDVHVTRLGNIRLHWPNRPSWARSHAALGGFCHGETSSDDDFFFTVRDGRGRSHIASGRLEVDNAGGVVHSIGKKPVLGPGVLGAFDDAGTTFSCAVRIEGRRALLYSGWTLGVSVPFYFYVGVAWEQADGGFAREGLAPLLDRSNDDPFLTASPFVVPTTTGLHMWYISATGWYEGPEGVYHEYLVKEATSVDGLDWTRSARPVLSLEEGEIAIGRPCVVQIAGRWWMFASARGDNYRCIAASSDDGLVWERLHDWEISGTGVMADNDMEAAAYPHVFARDGRNLMVWTGDGYGIRGMALGVLGATGA